MRLLVVTGFLTASSALASAQAPGDYYSDGSGGSSTSAPGETAPIVEPPAPTSPPAAWSGRDERWSLGLNVGSMSVAPPGYSTGDPTEFDIAELALRYRPWSHLELEFSLGGGRQSLADGSQGNLAMGNGQLALRYRFSPHTAWNWWLMAGVGQTIIAPHDSTKAERDAAKQSHGTFGIGLERRFHHFAIQTELRYVSIGSDRSSGDEPAPAPAPPTKTPGGTMTAPDPSTATSMPGRLDGGQFTLGISYYF